MPKPLDSALVLAVGRLLWRNSRKTERGAKQFLTGLAVLAAPFALSRNSRKTECGAKQFLTGLAVCAAPFALSRNSRKTECGAKQFLTGLAVLAAPFALSTVAFACGDKLMLSLGNVRYGQVNGSAHPAVILAYTPR